MSASIEGFEPVQRSMGKFGPKHSSQEHDGTGQASTNSYAAVTGSNVKSEGNGLISYVIKNTDGSNAIDVKLQGRNKQVDGDESPWVDAADLDGNSLEEASLSAGSTTTLSSEVIFDEYRVVVQSTVGGSHGSVEVWGSAR